MHSFSEIASQLDTSILMLKANMPFVLMVIGGLYLIHIVNFALRYHLNILGIYPRSLWGLPGIFFSPFLHGNFNHIFFNSIPLLILMSFILLSGFTTFCSVTLTVIVLGGLGTWLCGRKALHVGASGLIMGYWSYLLLNAYQPGTAIAIGLGIVCIYYLGGLLTNLFPTEAKSSFEAHIFGFLAGIAANYTTPYLNILLAPHLAHFGAHWITT